ncbi:hypothetical protein [Nitrosomonas aestuarii]|uniref:hypothetical protein n=1 Tax=Nitrosomonas aestuarii TaxID=52441 RepID=UPI0011B1CD4D|nr:hypothetical protein [Nitrosomonas aestuarii]
MEKFLLLLFVGLTISSCLPEERDSSAVRVEIAGRVFKVPKGYFDGAGAYGKDTESVVLEYSLPGFEVLPEYSQHKAERQKLISAGRMRGMLLQNEANRPSFNPVVKEHMRSADFKKEENLVYGLEKYVHQVPEPISPDPNYGPNIQNDILIERSSDGSVKSYLRCSPPGKYEIPGCEHRFIDKGLLYDIHWRIQELPNWRAQREAAIQFIDSLEYIRPNRLLETLEKHQSSLPFKEQE